MFYRVENNGEQVERPQEVKKIEVGKDAAMEAEMKAARERANIPIDVRMKEFREMLVEKQVRYSRRFDGLYPMLRCLCICQYLYIK